MSTVIELLEKMGQDARLRYAAPSDQLATLQASTMDPDLRAAFLARDQARLESLLGVNSNVCCALEPADDSPADDDEEIVPAKRLCQAA